MPRNSLRNFDAIDRGSSSAAQRSTARPRAADLAPPDGLVDGQAGPATDREPVTSLEDLTGLPEELQTLMRDRRALEQRMSALTGGTVDGGPDSSSGSGAGVGRSADDPRFPVTPLSVRRRDDDRWARRRDGQAPGRGLLDTGRSTRDAVGRGVLDAAGRRGGSMDRLAGPFREPPLRSGQRGLQTAGRELPSRTGSLDGLSVDRLRSASALRDLGRDTEPRVAEPALRSMRSPDDNLAGARRRLDILRGGSGDLDQLRETAMQRLAERRAEANQINRTARSRDGDETGRGPRSLDRPDRSEPDRRQQRRDQRRDQSRLDRGTERTNR